MISIRPPRTPSPCLQHVTYLDDVDKFLAVPLDGERGVHAPVQLVEHVRGQLGGRRVKVSAIPRVDVLPACATIKEGMRGKRT